MRKRSTLLAAASLAALMLALAAGAASANRLSVDDQDFVLAYPELQYVGGAGGSTTVTCDVTLSGSFRSGTFTKTVGAKIGEITRASVSECTGGRWIFLTETLPWEIKYSGFTGRLPQITGLRITFIGYSFSIDSPDEPTCLLRTSNEEPATQIFTVSSGTITSIQAETGDDIDSIIGDFYCEFIEMNFFGRASVEDGARASIRLLLI